MAGLSEKIKKRAARVGVIGLGYVGLPLAVEFARAGFRVTGIEIDPHKIEKVKRGRSHIQDVTDDEIASVTRTGFLTATDDFSVLKEIDAVSICVPTPLRKTKDPDISYIMSALKEIKRYLHPQELIVLESTTYPGTTDELILPELEQTGLKVGQDFFLAFSPERIDPGNKTYKTKNTPRVIGGITPACRDVALLLYREVIETVIPVSTTKSAEMVKLLENTFRAINIGLANEVAIMCDRLGIDVWEVIEAAATKPFGFIPFYPGPGLGGHCIPIDPHYLSWKLRMINYHARFIELASEINTGMPLYVVRKITDALNRQRKSVNGSRFLILGVSYKRDVGDIRESPALDIIRLLQEKGAEVAYNDPFVPDLHGEGISLTSVADDPDFSAYDCVVIVTDHTSYDYRRIATESRLVVDTRNATKGLETVDGRIVKL